MTGRLLLAEAGEASEAHTRAALSLDDGRELRFVDARRFGRLWLLRPGEEDTYTGMSGLGPEPDDPALDAGYLRGVCGKSRRAVKSCLLDQSVVAGIGNIYSDEILHDVHIRPDRPACSLDAGEWERLAEAIPRVMRFFTEKNLVTFEEYRQSAGTGVSQYAMAARLRSRGQGVRHMRDGAGTPRHRRAGAACSVRAVRSEKVAIMTTGLAGGSDH